MRLALAFVLLACSSSSTRPRGTADFATSEPTLPAHFTASAAAMDSSSGLSIVFSNLIVPADVCEPARVLAQNAPQSEADVAVLTVTVAGTDVGSGTYTETTGASATLEIATDQCGVATSEVASSVFLVIDRASDSISGSAKAIFANGPTVALFDVAICAPSELDAGGSCTHYPPCADGGGGACIDTP